MYDDAERRSSKGVARIVGGWVCGGTHAQKSTLGVKKTAPFYFCNNFFKPSSIL